MSYEEAKPGTYEHEQYSALKSLRVTHALVMDEINVILDRLAPKDSTEKAEIVALTEEVKTVSQTKTAEFDAKVDAKAIESAVKGG